MAFEGARFGPHGWRAILTAILVCTLAAVSVAVSRASASSLNIIRLDNGLTVVIQPQTGSRLATVQLFFRVSDSGDRAGLVHFLEHLLFTRTLSRPRGWIPAQLTLDTLYYNAFTTWDSMELISVCWPEAVPRVLEIELEQLTQLAPTDEEVELERYRIQGELTWRSQVSPYVELADRLAAQALGGAWYPITGTAAEVLSLTLEEAQTLRTSQLVGNRAVLLITGAVEPESTIAAVERTLGRLPPGDAPTTELDWEITAQPSYAGDDLDAEPRSFVIERPDLDGYLLMVGFPLPFGTEQERALVWYLEAMMDREGAEVFRRTRGDRTVLVAVEYGSFDDLGHYARDHQTRESRMRRLRDSFWYKTKAFRTQMSVRWLAASRREKLMADIGESLADAATRADWITQRLRDGEASPDPADQLAAIETLHPDTIRAFIRETMRPERALIGEAVGTVFANNAWQRFADEPGFNPYVDWHGRPATFTADTLIAAGARLTRAGGIEVVRRQLDNGITLHHLLCKDTNDLWIAGCRYFDTHDIGTPDVCGAFWLWSIAANSGYGPLRRDREPVGKYLTHGVSLYATPAELRFSAHSSPAKVEGMGNALCKRLDEPSFPEGLFRYLRMRPEILRPGPLTTEDEARLWRLSELCGTDHPLICAMVPGSRQGELADYEILKRIHQRACDAGGSVLVSAGDLPASDVARALNPSLGDRKNKSPDLHPALPTPATGELHRTFTDTTASDQVLTVTLAPCRLVPAGTIERLDLPVLGGLARDRVEAACHTAGLYAVSIRFRDYRWCDVVIPELVVRFGEADHRVVFDAVKSGIASLRATPPTEVDIRYRQLIAARELALGLDEPTAAVWYLLDLATGGELPSQPLAGVLTSSIAQIVDQLELLFNDHCMVVTHLQRR